MRTLMVGMQMTLDGMIEGPGGWKDFMSNWDEDYGVTTRADTCVLGAGMYAEYGSYWQAIVDAPDAPMPQTGEPPHADEIAYARWATRIPHVVLSRTMQSARWPLTRFARSTDEIAALKQVEGGDIYVVGGAATVASLMDADLVDEWQIVVHPIALGAGKPLFGTLERRHGLTLIASSPQSDGSVRLTYGRG